MTIANDDSMTRFHGSGSTGPFDWGWRFLDNDDVLVYLITDPDEGNPTEVRELLGVGDYTMTGAGSYDGGSLTLAVALETGQDLLVVCNTAILQPFSIRNQGGVFRPEVHEEAFDRLTMMIRDRVNLVNEYLTTLQSVTEQLAAVTSLFTGLQAGDGLYIVTEEGGKWICQEVDLGGGEYTLQFVKVS